MQFHLNDKQRLLGQAAIGRMERRIDASFEKFKDDVKSIELSISDVNGPRGGVDKACRVLVNLRRKRKVVVTVTEESTSKAIQAAIEKATRSVGKKIKRSVARRDQRQLALS
jgi:hypothetical protein